jgi:Eco57I restriction-modification methylase
MARGFVELRGRPIRSVPSRHVRAWRVAPLTAQELLAALAGVPGSKTVPVEDDGIVESRVVGGVEIALAAQQDEQALRKLWRGRFGGGPTPLLLVADEPDQDEVLRTLGPLGHDSPIRLVGSADLLSVLERLPSLGKLQAVRELAEELERLDRTGVSGLQVKGLGTQHLFTTRLRDDPRWSRLEELSQDLPGDWRPLFEQLGYEVEQLPGRNWLLQANGKPAALVRPLADASAFAKLDAEGRPPEGLLIQDCLEQGVPYGFLASGGRLRLFEAKPVSGSAVARYLELDASTLTDNDRPLLGLLAPEYLAGEAFESLMRDARDFGAKLRERIDAAIRQTVLPALGRELGEWAEREGIDLADDEKREELEAAALAFVFRALFLLYAESARHLPVDHEAYRPHSFTQIVRDAAEGVSARSTTLWDRIKVLVAALRQGEDSWLVPAYNGALFAADGFEGAEILERASMRNDALAPALVALGIDDKSGAGYDFSGLAIGHLGHIYEGLLSLRLSVADRPYTYHAKSDRYVAAGDEDAEVKIGKLLWLTDEGGRKGGGVYYTPEPLVRHLVRRGVGPAFERHLEEVEGLAEDDPDSAAHRLLQFRVLDPACGSAHFLVAVVDELADVTARFLARRPLPALRAQVDDLRAGAGATYGVGIEDVSLLRRLVLKHCVYGVDLSPMGAEIAKISLWLASFVPGLSLAYLDHNVKVGNSLIGVADKNAFTGFAADVLNRAVDDAAEAATRLLDVKDRTPDEVEESKQIEREALKRGAKARTLLDLWVAEPLGLPGARDLAWGQSEDLDKPENAEAVLQASALARDYRAVHWPLEFPEVFASDGFDAIVGNPPWEQVRTDEVSFFVHHWPGLKSLSEAERRKALEDLRKTRPELESRFQAELERLERLRTYWSSDTGFTTGGGGFPDLYKLFCQRYGQLLRSGGALSVVLPRAAFVVMGSADFRQWLFEQNTPERLDFLVNAGRWAFDAEPRYTAALLVARSAARDDSRSFEVAGVANSETAFANQTSAPGLRLTRAALGPLLEVPLLQTAEAAALLQKLRGDGTRFPHGSGRWSCFAVQELNEKFDRHLWEGATEGWELWKGESFDQFNPHGAENRLCPPTDEVRAKVNKARPGAGSILAADVPTPKRVEAVAREVGRARVAFRDVSRATDSRTLRAALVPPETFLLNSAPYLAFVEGDNFGRSCCLGVMNSLPLDWQARRFVENHVNFFILEGLLVPALDDRTHDQIGRAAARLSCPDERFADFAAATGVEVGPLTPEERNELRAEIDALVARAYGLDEADLETIFADFTRDAVPETYRDRVRNRFRELTEKGLTSPVTTSH